MSSPRRFADIQKRHEKLYDIVVNNHQSLLKNEEELEAFIKQADELLEDMKTISANPTEVDDAVWLSSAATAWRLAFTTYLNIPRDIRLAPPQATQLAPQRPTRVLLEEEIFKLLKDKSYNVYKYRKVGDWLRKVDELLKEKQGGGGEDEDWFVANVDFMMQILLGQIDFARQLKSSSYRRMEEYWLRHVKELRAYHISLNAENEADRYDAERHYYQACDEIRGMLVNDFIKASPKLFEEAKAYLKSEYLTGGKINPSKNGRAQALIAGKAFDLSRSPATSDEKTNWKRSETYVRMFYENIIPAVEEDDDESTLLVLKALQFSGDLNMRYRIVNCFEAALAIYFLNPNKIRELWMRDEDAPRPVFWCVSEVETQTWPEKFDAYKICGERFRFDALRRRIVFEGVMTTAQKEALREKLSLEEHVSALESLFAKSRLLPSHSTL
ncbi:MAG TPA: hypothetical protein VGB73_12615 [Pyrinomonadaceae bacterium]|jgi:hypothetical protein